MSTTPSSDPGTPPADQATAPRRMSTMELALNACRLALSLVLDGDNEALVLWTDESGSDDVLRSLAVALIAQNDRLAQRGEPRYRLPVDMHWNPDGSSQVYTPDEDITATGERDVLVVHARIRDVADAEGRIADELINQIRFDVDPACAAQVIVVVEQQAGTGRTTNEVTS